MKRDLQTYLERKKQVQERFDQMISINQDIRLKEHLTQISRSVKKTQDFQHHSNHLASILLVDDLTYITKTVSYMLNKEQYSVHVAMNGAEGIAQFMNHLPDLVITDLRLPDFSGVVLAKFLRKLDEEVPIIFITANDTDAETGRTLNTEIRNLDPESDHMTFLPKPIQKEVILNTIEYFLNIEHGDKK